MTDAEIAEVARQYVRATIDNRDAGPTDWHRTIAHLNASWHDLLRATGNACECDPADTCPGLILNQGRLVA